MHQNFCYHIHTARCGHADTAMIDEDTVRQFIDCGYKSIAFTDHCPWKEFLKPYNPGHAMEWSEKENYFNSIRQLADKYKDKIEILAGLEIEYLSHLEEEMKELVSLCDIVIVGQHFTYSRDHGFTSIHKGGFVPNDEEMDYYADALVSACKSGFVSVICHPDLYMIHKTQMGRKEEEIAHRICKAAEQYHVPIELNLCQISKNHFFEQCRVAYPNKGFWEIAKSYNLDVIYGLDYHGFYRIEDSEFSYDEADRILGKDLVNSLNFISGNKIKKLCQKN